jgi:hypothetical protein
MGGRGLDQQTSVELFVVTPAKMVLECPARWVWRDSAYQHGWIFRSLKLIHCFARKSQCDLGRKKDSMHRAAMDVSVRSVVQ